MPAPNAPGLVHDGRVGHRVDADPALRGAMADRISGDPGALTALGRHRNGCRDALQDLRIHTNALHATATPSLPSCSGRAYLADASDSLATRENEGAAPLCLGEQNRSGG